jgi:hypothetical protein
MCKPKPQVIAEYRDILDDLLRPHIKEETTLVQLIMDICSLSERTYAGKVAERRGTLESMVEGLNRIETIKSKCYNLFHLNYPWKTKLGQETLEFLCQRPENETVDQFAAWWETQDWRGQRRQPPTLMQIVEYWPQAFVQQDNIQDRIFRVEDR